MTINKYEVENNAIIQKFATESEATEFIDFEIGSYTFEKMYDNCQNEIIKVANGKRILTMKWFNYFIVIVDSE